ncbi:hypothetical protein RNI52_26730 [Labrys neptuniae]|uniref:hypothetical protein n=1 Tax=Labrys TaxID=204476 RepID=UPI00288EE778|nr:hypothetical protein [Labrys neptuniae]MDT3380951.1 hypothetical protein [Labrys neptuniae]
MEIWTELDSLVTAEGDRIALRRRGGLFDIRFNGWELMSNHDPRSEIVLARTICRHLDAQAPRILIGGLGMGYTLRATLDATGPQARILVSELLPEIVAWNRGVLAPLAGHPLADPRVEVRTGSVAEIIAAEPGGFDAILLDTDNGPDYVVHAPNHWLYSGEGIARIISALAPGGVAGLWSATQSKAFEANLAASALPWRRERVSLGEPGQEPFHMVYLIGVPAG